MGSNALLDRLPAELRARVNPLLETVRLDKGANLFSPGDNIDYGYFPIGGLVSLVAITTGGDAVELAAVSREGVVGIHALLNATPVCHQATVQLPGLAL